MAKTPFELTAAALKIMGKKVASKKDSHAVTMCVFIPNGDTHAIATDGNIIALLDLNKYENLSKHGILEELLLLLGKLLAIGIGKRHLDSRLVLLK